MVCSYSESDVFEWIDLVPWKSVVSAEWVWVEDNGAVVVLGFYIGYCRLISFRTPMSEHPTCQRNEAISIFLCSANRL